MVRVDDRNKDGYPNKDWVGKDTTILAAAVIQRLKEP